MIEDASKDNSKVPSLQYLSKDPNHINLESPNHLTSFAEHDKHSPTCPCVRERFFCLSYVLHIFYWAEGSMI